MSQTIGDRNEGREVVNGNGGNGRAIIDPQAAPTSAYAMYMQRALPGMKGDSMDDNVDTFACGPTSFGFGLVVGRTAPHLLTVMMGGPDPVGLSLHDHTIASRGGYTQYDAVSVLTRGRAWCQVTVGAEGPIDDGIYVSYDPATGMVSSAAGTALPNAVFRSKAVPFYDINYVNSTFIALVEMHYPLAVPGP
jgi:hypothetical protein